MYLHIPPLNPLRFSRQSSLIGLRMKYSPYFTVFREHLAYLMPNSPLQLPTLDKYQRMPKDTLRWRVTSRPAAGTVQMAVAREKLRRKVRAAFREGLEKEGYAWDGTRQEQTKTPKADLKGTWEVICQTGDALNVDPEELVEAARTCVQLVEAQGPAANSARQRRKAREPDWWEIDLVRLTQAPDGRSGRRKSMRGPG